jgi:hypothetical protein
MCLRYGNRADAAVFDPNQKYQEKVAIGQASQIRPLGLKCGYYRRPYLVSTQAAATNGPVMAIEMIIASAIILVHSQIDTVQFQSA